MTPPLPTPSNASNNTQRRDRYGAWWCCGLGLLLLVARGCALQGWLSPVRIAGGSMAPAYLGEHATLRCPRCRFAHDVDLQPWQVQAAAICPQCRELLDSTTEVAVHRGDQVLIDRSAFWFRSPQRWETVAFWDHEHAATVKRILALPGEPWEIRKGDLVVNDKLVRKTSEQFLAMAVLVHADAFRAGKLAPRWCGVGDHSQWQATSSGYQHRAQLATSEPDWLEYRHVPEHPAAAQQSVPVSDFDAYNPAIPRVLQSVTDLCVSGVVRVPTNTTLHFRVHDGYTWQERKFSAKAFTDNSGCTFQFGLCDRTLWLTVNGHSRERTELPEMKAAPQAVVNPIAVGISGAAGTVELTSLNLLRDIHYLDALGRTDHSPLKTLAANEYAVLGDNQPLSIDSRLSERGITRDRILGPVLPWRSERTGSP